MLTHSHPEGREPTRLVVLGARGVIGARLCALCAERQVPLLALSSADLDLLAEGAGEQLSGLLRPDDTLVALSALTPDKGRDIATLMKNLRMAEAVCVALASSPVAQVIYMSSDAVYRFVDHPVTELTPADPPDLYGIMHRAREVMFSQTQGQQALAILRCTLVCAAEDTHNSYGPNRFRRMAAMDGRITLGGKGEETRDHVDVGDVARLILEVARYGSAGLLNLASGTSLSFDSVARLVASQFDPPVEIVHSERRAPVTHRHFDVTALHVAFPRFHFEPLKDSLRRAHQAEIG